MKYIQSTMDVVQARNQYARLFFIFFGVGVFLLYVWYTTFTLGQNKVLIAVFGLIGIGYAVYSANKAVTYHYQYRNIRGDHLNRSTKRC